MTQDWISCRGPCACLVSRGTWRLAMVEMTLIMLK
jgi:hypothetical protein